MIPRELHDLVLETGERVGEAARVAADVATNMKTTRKRAAKGDAEGLLRAATWVRSDAERFFDVGRHLIAEASRMEEAARSHIEGAGDEHPMDYESAVELGADPGLPAVLMPGDVANRGPVSMEPALLCSLCEAPALHFADRGSLQIAHCGEDACRAHYEQLRARRSA